jgi:hypothetical protein
MRRRDRYPRQLVRKSSGRHLATSLALVPSFPLADHADHIHLGL